MATDRPARDTTLALPPAVALSGEQFQQLLTTLSSATDRSPELAAAVEAIRLQAETQRTYAKEFERQVRRSNRHHPNLSVYTYDPRCAACVDHQPHLDPETQADLGLAHPKPALKYDTFFCYSRVREDDLTPVELELYNAFDADKEVRDGKWTATIRKDGTKRQLHIMVPFQGLDALADLPPLTQILSELLYGTTVMEPMAVMAMQAAMQRQIDELRAALDRKESAA
jgi:hypothetical protein